MHGQEKVKLEVPGNIGRGVRAQKRKQELTQNFAVVAKHIRSHFRLYGCSRLSGCDGNESRVNQNPAVAAAGCVTRNCSGSWTRTRGVWLVRLLLSSEGVNSPSRHS
jgi:hypothetical protein